MSFDAPNPPYNSTDPSAKFLSSSALDFLLIELVPLAYRVSQDRDSSLGGGGELSESNGNNNTAVSTTGAAGSVTDGSGGGMITGAGKETTTGTVMGEETIEAVRHRLDMQGYRVGQGLVERCVCSFAMVAFLRSSPSPSLSLGSETATANHTSDLLWLRRIRVLESRQAWANGMKIL